eukprot:COSAG02_NODE_1786_length_10940_cov_3.960981_2_plen_56_part_00
MRRALGCYDRHGSDEEEDWRTRHGFIIEFNDDMERQHAQIASETHPCKIRANPSR